MSLVGREREIRMLDQSMETGRPEFVAVYGRRRVGKTHLVRQYFQQSFSFYATGVENESMRVQLRTFHIALQDYGEQGGSAPAALRKTLRRSALTTRASCASSASASSNRSLDMRRLTRLSFGCCLSGLWA